jgi:hypothetical protein
MSIEHHAILMIQFLKPVMIVMIPSRVQQWSSFSTFFFQILPAFALRDGSKPTCLWG